MLKAAKKLNPLAALKSGVKNLPMEVRMSLWVLVGKAMGLPVDEIFRLIDLQLTTAKRNLNGRRVRMSLAERLKMAKLAKKIGTRFNNLFSWLIAPDSLIKWVKRYQARKAHSSEEQQKIGRPWISKIKVDAILKIYDSGITGLKRIMRELIKSDLEVSYISIRQVLNQNGMAPNDTNRTHKSTWGQFLKRYSKHIIGVDFIQTPLAFLVESLLIMFSLLLNTTLAAFIFFE